MTLYTDAEFAAYLKVRSVLAGSRRNYFNAGAKAALEVFAGADFVTDEELRRLIYACYGKPSTARAGYHRAIKRLIESGHVNKRRYGWTFSRQADSPTDSQAQPDCDA